MQGAIERTIGRIPSGIRVSRRRKEECIRAALTAAAALCYASLFVIAVLAVVSR